VRRFRLFFLFTIVFIYSCWSDSKNEAIIGQWEMVPIVYDLITVDEYQNMLKAMDSSVLDSSRFQGYEQVFKLNNTNQTDFKKSYEYYLSRPDILNSIYDSVQRLASKSRGYQNGIADSILPLKKVLKAD
jgi:hypothetical protein